MKRIVIFLLMLFMSVNIYAKMSPIVDTDWVLAHLNDKDLIILDIRANKQDFYKGHIPNAIYVNKSDIRIDKEINGKLLEGYLPDKAYFQNLLRSYGINNNSKVVIYTIQYGIKNLKYATRLYWQFKLYGFQNVTLMEGGYLKWLKESKPIEKGDQRNVAEGDVILKDADNSMIATTEDVEKALKDKSYILVDFRDFQSYLGSNKASYIPYPGHIPGAFVAPEELFCKKDGSFVDKTTALNTFHALNIDLDKKIIIYCNTGNHSTEGWMLIHELLGKKNISMYDGSLIEWTNLNKMTKLYEVENFK
ncbi:sulfurtransferase [Deferribacteraceae bacterium V6Fe1]|nr:sulfurtransferase [Deferribacteraceae bacterium V6Fe1]